VLLVCNFGYRSWQPEHFGKEVENSLQNGPFERDVSLASFYDFLKLCKYPLFHKCLLSSLLKSCNINEYCKLPVDYLKPVKLCLLYISLEIIDDLSEDAPRIPGKTLSQRLFVAKIGNQSVKTYLEN
jgi:hypothetical protein